MSYITRTGNLTGTPELRENDKGVKYTYARVAVSDRIKDGEGYTDGPAIFYDVAVSGNQAVQLVEAAEASGNIRIMFAGDYRVTAYTPADGGEPRIQHEVRADDVAVSLRGQSVTVARSSNGE